MVLFFTFYHCKSPLIYHLGNIFWIFFANHPTVAIQQKVPALVMTGSYCWWLKSGDRQLIWFSYPMIYILLYMPSGQPDFFHQGYVYWIAPIHALKQAAAVPERRWTAKSKMWTKNSRGCWDGEALFIPVGSMYIWYMYLPTCGWNLW